MAASLFEQQPILSQSAKAKCRKRELVLLINNGEIAGINLKGDGDEDDIADDAYFHYAKYPGLFLCGGLIIFGRESPH